MGLLVYTLLVRGQLLDRPEYGPTEFIRPSPVQTPVEGFTYITTRQPEIDVLLVVGHDILGKREPEVRSRAGETVPYHS